MYNMLYMKDHEKDHLKLINAVTVGPKGQVVIPAEVREEMNVKPGDKLFCMFAPHKKAVGFLPESGVQEIVDAMGSRLEAFRNEIDKHQNE